MENGRTGGSFRARRGFTRHRPARPGSRAGTVERMQDASIVPWPDRIRRVAFLFAMSAEGRGFAERLGLEDRGSLDPDLPAHWLAGTHESPGGAPIEVAVGFAGTDPEHGIDRIGTTPATLAAYLLARRFDPDLLVNAGTCGGFEARGASVGTVYLGSKALLFHDRRVPLPGFDAFGVGRIAAEPPSFLFELLHAVPGIVSTGDSFTPCAEELAFFETEGVQAKDMEATAIARLSRDLGIPFLAVKAVTDLVDDPEPEHDAFVRNLARVSSLLGDRLHALVEALSIAQGRPASIGSE